MWTQFEVSQALTRRTKWVSFFYLVNIPRGRYSFELGCIKIGGFKVFLMESRKQIMLLIKNPSRRCEKCLKALVMKSHKKFANSVHKQWNFWQRHFTCANPCGRNYSDIISQLPESGDAFVRNCRHQSGLRWCLLRVIMFCVLAWPV